MSTRRVPDESCYRLHHPRSCTNINYKRYRKYCLSRKSKLHKNWVKEGEPKFTGMFFVRHDDFLGDLEIAEYYINKKGEGNWMSHKRPSAWSEIETYEYVDKEESLIYEDEYIR